MEPARAAVERAREAQAQMTIFMCAYAVAIRPAVQRAATAFAEISRAAQAAGLVDEQGKPVKHTDRPSWQSPYGPGRRRR